MTEKKRIAPSPGYEIPLPQNWCADHYDDDVNPPIELLPTPLTDLVNESNPLEFDLYWSMRSPYSYLVLDRILALNATYNVKVNFRPLLPIVVRAGGFPGAPWYRWNYDMIDAHRRCSGTRQGFGVSRSCHAHDVGRPDRRLAQIPVEYMDRAGMDGKAVDADVAANPEKYDAILHENAAAHTACGHGGVPLMAFRGEPFFGQDSFDLFFWRLQQNGLTRRREALAKLPNDRPTF